MNIRGVFCHFVASFVTFVSIGALANTIEVSGKSCQRLFSDAGAFEIPRDRATFSSSDKVMRLLKAGVLTQLRTANTSKDNIEFFQNQVPLILAKLNISLTESNQLLKKPARYATERQLRRPKDNLEKGLAEAYKLLTTDAVNRIRDNSVTYEWYMEFFLKSLIFVDVTTRIFDHAESHEQVEMLSRRVNTILGRTKTFLSNEVRELQLYSSLSPEFSRLTRNSYFRRYLPEHVIVPVLFIPKSQEIIEAEAQGVHFVTLTAYRQNTIEGQKFPLELASYQQGLNLNRIYLFKDFVNPESKWLKLHNKIAQRITGDAGLEAIYAHLLHDVGLQLELTKRFEVKSKPFLVAGHRISFVPQDVDHRVSNYLNDYFSKNHSAILKVSNQASVDAFKKVIYQIEKEALASRK